jgi:hypothetical protein
MPTTTKPKSKTICRRVSPRRVCPITDVAIVLETPH